VQAGINDLATTHPEIAAQLVDQSLATALSAGSGQKADWLCPDHGHLNRGVPVYSRVADSGCRYCADKSTLAGFNDLATTHPEVAAQLADQSLARTLRKGSRRKVDWTCSAGHRFTAMVKVRVKAFRDGHEHCPICQSRTIIPGVNDLATTHPELAARLVDPNVAKTVGVGHGGEVMWSCLKGHVYPNPVVRMARAVSRGKAGCPVCHGKTLLPGVNDLATTHPHLVKFLSDPAQARTVSAGSDKKIALACDKPHQPALVTVSNLVAGQTGCPVCLSRQIEVGFNDLATTHPDLAAEWHPTLNGELTPQDVSKGMRRYVWWVCGAGHDPWLAAIYHRATGAVTKCPSCSRGNDSETEREFVKALKLLAQGSRFSVRTHSRRELGALGEIDVVFDDNTGRPTLGVELNGVYWHSEAGGKDRHYHLSKTAAAHRAGLPLLHIWGDSWSEHPSIALRLIAHRLKLVGNMSRLSDDPRVWQRVGARELNPVQVADHGLVRAFLEANHIQGSVITTRSFALADIDGDIRALLCLRDAANNARMRRKPGVWEVQRYATLGVVPGGFSRLLAHAEKTLLAESADLRQWVSFSDNQISDGALYRISGWRLDASLPPDYTYAGNRTGWVRRPKERYQRKRFRDDPNLVWDDAWTEAQAAVENGLHRVWDCGKTRWLKEVPMLA
jgi:hypothetical protein